MLQERIKQWLQGKPLGHPLHPLLIHFPIGLFVLSLMLDFISLAASQGNYYVRGAFYALAAGIVTALAAAAAGLADWWDIRRDHPARPIATHHMILNLWAVSLYVVGLVLRWGALDAARTPSLPLLLSLGAAAVLSVSGYLGGKLIYEEGIAVGRHRRRSSTPAETIERFAEPGEWVAVAAAADVADGGTLRVAINGRVITVANVEGSCYAFQEFCTHRFGPLSEGTFEGQQVVCPWHRSCFDIRSGQVNQGPAKVPLRTFESQIRDGQIWLKATAKEERQRRQEE
jgi:nitrite reductase/ring-hydroxylating ferredoxin subunit/uncharacterized membrane protein